MVVRISDREFWIEFLRAQNVPEERWQEMLQIIDKSEREPREKTAARLGALAEPVFEILEDGGKSEKLDALLAGLRERGLAEFVKVDLRIVRGLAYYTGVVFEAFDRARQTAAHRRRRALRQSHCATERRGGVAPGARFRHGRCRAWGIDRREPAASARMEEAIATAASARYLSWSSRRRSVAWMRSPQIQALRDAGYRVDYPLTPAKIGKQFQTAEQLGARVAVLFGDEWPQVKVKDLTTRRAAACCRTKTCCALRRALAFPTCKLVNRRIACDDSRFAQNGQARRSCTAPIIATNSAQPTSAAR